MIIFKDGRKKVIQKALDNEIKVEDQLKQLINPLWIHDCTTRNTKLNPDFYQIKKSYTELLLENKKRRYNDLVINPIKSATPAKKRKMKSNCINKSKSQGSIKKYFDVILINSILFKNLYIPN